MVRHPNFFLHISLSHSFNNQSCVDISRVSFFLDEAARLQSTQRLAFTDPFYTSTNARTASIEEVFPESDALREYREKWTSRPFAKKTTHSVDFKNFHKE